MCVLALAWKTHPRYRLIFAGNRDERHSRPTAPAGWWEDAPQVLGGRDLEAGGTWLGLTRDGRFAVVTNYREPDNPAPPGTPSRGELTADYLVGDITPAAFLELLRHSGRRYAGFNLLFGNSETLYYYSNRLEPGARVPAGELAPGIYGLSNGVLETPWPKMRRIRQSVADAAHDGPDVAALFTALGDTRRAPDGDLPDTGVGLDYERLLSPPCIVHPEYGTRASTVILIGTDGETEFHEQSRRPDGGPGGRQDFHFMLDA